MATRTPTRARKVAEYCSTMPGGKQVIDADMWQLHLSARVWHRVLKVGRTITDREGVDLIVTPHIARALQHREREGE